MNIRRNLNRVSYIVIALFIWTNLQQIMFADKNDHIAICNPGFNNDGEKWIYDWGWGANTVQFVSTPAKVNVARIIYSGSNWVYLWPQPEANEKFAFRSGARYAISFLAQWEEGDNRLEIGFRRANIENKKIYPNERTQERIVWRGSVPKDGKWHKLTAIVKTPTFDSGLYYLVPAFGMCSQTSRLKSTLNLDDISVAAACPGMKDTVEDYQCPPISNTPQVKALLERITAARKQIAKLEDAIAVAQRYNRDVSKARASLAIMKYFPIRPDYFEIYLQPDELTPENLRQISTKLDYIESRSAKWLDFLANSGEKPCPPKTISHNMANLKVKDGYFEADGTPVLLMGPEGDRLRILEDLDFVRDLGANAVGVEVTPLDVAASGFADNLRHFLDEAQKRNLTVRVMLSGHFFPAEVSSLQEAQRVLYYPMYQGFFMVASSQKVCIESGPVRKVLKDFVHKVTDVTKNHSAVSSYVIWNEPYYMCYCEQSIKEFQNYIAQKYKNIESLNIAWKGEYKNFSQCLPPKILQENWKYCIKPNNRVALHDWLQYNDDRMFRFFKWMKDSLRENGDTKPTHVKKGSWQFAAYGSMGGIDSERLNTELEETPGFDTGYTYDPQGDFSIEPVMSVDFADSTSCGKPISHDELHMIIPPGPDGARPPRDANIMRSCIFEDFVHGVDQQYFFVWRKGTYYHSLLDPKATPAGTLESYCDAIIDIQRLSREIMLLQKARRNVAIFYGQTNFLYTPAELLGGAMFKTLQLGAMEDCYHALFSLSHPIRFITESQINTGHFDSMNVIIVPTTQYVPQKTCDAILEFVRSGGTLIIGAYSFIGDDRMQYNGFMKQIGVNVVKRTLPQLKMNADKVSEIGELLAHTTAIETMNSVKTDIITEKTDVFTDKRLTLNAFGIREEINGGTVLARYTDGIPAVIVKNLGKGKIYYLGTNLDRNDMSVFLEQIFKNMPDKVCRPVIGKTQEGKVPFGIEIRSVKDGNDLLVYAFNPTQKAIEIKLYGVLSKSGIDMFTQKPCGESIILGPVTPILIKYPAKP